VGQATVVRLDPARQTPALTEVTAVPLGVTAAA